jgi:hypothetical protein
MFNLHRATQYKLYNQARSFLINNPEILIDLEQYFSKHLTTLLKGNLDEIQKDFDEASLLFPFWQNYPPDHRGRQPRGDQFPWIEVGEHVIGDKLTRMLADDFSIRDVGLPTGPDKRYVLSNDKILQITKKFTNSIWLFLDIKSVGPRDDSDHTVMSHNQISGDGVWNDQMHGISNTTMKAKGKQKTHDFHCSIPPLYILSTKEIVPVIVIAIKPVYKMLILNKPKTDAGQPLGRLDVISIPNGLLLEKNPHYLKKYPGLFYPGKDDKGKNPRKMRSRISFDVLRQIAEWRVTKITV